MVDDGAAALKTPITSARHPWFFSVPDNFETRHQDNQSRKRFPISSASIKQDSIDMRPIFSVLQRTAPRAWQHPISSSARSPRSTWKLDSICARCRRQQMQVRFFNGQQMGDDPRWISVVDQPAQIVRTGRKHGPGLIILGILNLTLQNDCLRDRITN